MLRYVARDFATARRMADVDGISQIKLFCECRNVGGVGVHVVAVIRLARAPVSTPIVRDHAIALLQEE